MRAHAHDVAQRSHAPHQVVMYAELDLAADPEWRRQKHVERVVDGALARVLDRNDAEIGVASLDFVEHLLDRGQRERTDGMSEMLEHGLLREGALGTEIPDLERVLL